MCSNIFNKVARVVFVFITLCISFHANAGLQTEMQKMFNGMVNVTEPHAYSAQGRGVIAGGSINVRFKTSAAPQIGFIPPSVKGGCNGIDMFGGSLSFINMDQFIQLSKNIAQNAAGYAFGIAMEGLCPTCAQEMKNLQKIVQDINGKMLNSCEAAKKIVHQTSLEEWKNARVKDAQLAATKDGYYTDQLASWVQSVSGSITDNMTEASAKQLEGNVVWQALQDAGVSSWFSSTADNDLMRVLMSLTGTVVISRMVDSDSKTSFTPKAYEPILHFQDLLNGIHNDTTNLAYSCDSTDCLNPKAAVINFDGMKEIVQGYLFGAAYKNTLPSDLGTGIVKKLNTRGAVGQLTNEEIAFISASRPPIVALLRDVAGDEATVRALAIDLTEVIAIETAAGFVMQSIDVVEHALNGKWKKENESVLSKVQEARKDAYAQVRAAQALITSLKEKQEVARFAASVMYRSNTARVRASSAKFDN